MKNNLKGLIHTKINKIYIKIKVRVMILRHNTQKWYKEHYMVPLGQTIHESTVYLIKNWMTLKVDLDLKSLK